MQPKYNLIQSVQRSITLLEHLADMGQPTGITAIAAKVGLHKSTCFGLLHTLLQAGYVVQDDHGRYSLGYKVLDLGFAYLNALDIRKVAEPILHELSRFSGETVHFVLREGLNVVYIDKIDGARQMTLTSRIGKRTAMHCTAVGKAVLAYLTPEEQDTVLSAPLKAKTKYTLTDPVALKECLAQIRRDGYSEDAQEFTLGLNCVAVPVFRAEGKIFGAISISVPDARIPKKRKQEFIIHLQKAAAAISRQFGHVHETE